MSKFFSILLSGAAILATVLDTADSTPLARKTGGAPERLQQKQLNRHKGSTQNQPEPTRLARKVGGSKTRLLHRQRAFYRSRTA